MKIFRDAYEKLNIQSVVALGCFDGVHAGHENVIGAAVRLAQERGCKAVVWCFYEPPKNAYLPEPVRLITDAEEKARRIRKLGADILVMPDFTPRIASLSCEEFVSEVLCECAGATAVVCGRNYTFGQGGRGDTRTLRALCEPLGITVSVVEDVTLDGVKISSSLIREALSVGSCRYAARLLGRDFGVTATRVGGEALFIPKKYLCPPDGEYGVRVSAKSKKYETTATVTATEEGSTVTLGRDTDECECRVYFLTDRKRSNRNRKDI